MARIWTAPNGKKLQGTKETVPGIAQVDPDAPINEDGEPNYTGSTDVDWDEQETFTSFIEGVGYGVVWVDEDGDEWHASQLVLTEQETDDAD